MLSRCWRGVGVCQISMLRGAGAGNSIIEPWGTTLRTSGEHETMTNRATKDHQPRKTGGNVLILGGGGARGFAHFGVLQVLEEAGVRIDRIIGVSIGALVGAVYCNNPNAAEVIDVTRNYITSDRFTKYYNRMMRTSKRAKVGNGDGADEAPEEEHDEEAGRWFGKLRDYLKATFAFHRVVMKQSILPNKPLADCLSQIAVNQPIEDLKLPLTIVAADLKTGSRVRMEDGDLFSAVLGSAALPGIFPPVDRGPHLLADYGVVCSIPVSTALHYKPSRIIGVDLTPELVYRDSFSSGLDVLNRMEEIGCYLFKEHTAAYADVMIRPAVSHVDWADFADMDDVIERGVVAAEAVLPTLLKTRNAG